MRKVICYECAKHYDYDDDGFCPRCGAFNAPAGVSRISADGSVIRVDGLNERNHTNSFVHEELHREARKRSFLKLDFDPVEKPVRLAGDSRNAFASPMKAGKNKKPGFVLAVIVFVLCINFILPLLMALFSLW